MRRKRRLKLGGLGRGHLCYREARLVLPIINLATIVLIAFVFGGICLLLGKVALVGWMMRSTSKAFVFKVTVTGEMTH